MKIHELTIESKKDRKRLGRGIGSGTGKTSGRGTKGQNSRSGGGVRIGFEGGQNPLAKRLPKKRGFQSLNPSNYTTVNLAVLESLKGVKITNQSLFEQGIIVHAHDSVKILGTGKLTKKLTVEVQSATATAVTAIIKAGGTFTTIQPAKTPKKPSKRNRKA